MPKYKILYEVSMSLPGDRGSGLAVLKGLLLGYGLGDEDIIEFKARGEICLNVYLTSLSETRCLKAYLRKLDVARLKVIVKSLKDKDWQDRWKTDFKPFRLTRRFDVVPAWLKEKHRTSSGRTSVYIDTQLAFGTGLHETTRLMAEFIDAYRGKYKNFLDIGTGTGILSILAAHAGAVKLKAIDVSEDSIRVARENFLINGFKRNIFRHVDLAQLKETSVYDFVAANLITDDLIHFKDKIAGLVCPGKYLAVSGISVENYPRFKKEFAPLPLRCVRIKKGKKWVGLLYQRKCI